MHVHHVLQSVRNGTLLLSREPFSPHLRLFATFCIQIFQKSFSSCFWIVFNIFNLYRWFAVSQLNILFASVVFRPNRYSVVTLASVRRWGVRVKEVIYSTPRRPLAFYSRMSMNYTPHVSLIKLARVTTFRKLKCPRSPEARFLEPGLEILYYGSVHAAEAI